MPRYMKIISDLYIPGHPFCVIYTFCKFIGIHCLCGAIVQALYQFSSRWLPSVSVPLCVFQTCLHLEVFF